MNLQTHKVCINKGNSLIFFFINHQTGNNIAGRWIEKHCWIKKKSEKLRKVSKTKVSRNIKQQFGTHASPMDMSLNEES